MSAAVRERDGRGALVDWSVAASTGAYLARGGPAMERSDADRVVTDLRELTAEAERHVRDLTGLGAGLPLRPGEVVDRPGWVRAAAAGLDRLTSRAMPSAERPGGPGRALAPVLAGSAGVQTGAVLAFLGSRVLGQYDPFGGDDHEGTLLLVAPNVVTAQRAMRVPGRDFRMWVCLHECTHRLQFTAVEWLREYFADEVGRLITGFAESDGLTTVLSQLPDNLRRARRDGALGVAELVQSPSQRAVFDRLIALSTLLEGHADYVMDAVGPAVVPSVATIRRRVTARRSGGSLLDRVLRSVLGVDAKVRQYALGSAFTREVIDTVGMAGFNAVWTSPNTLPSRSEIKDPKAWLRRVQ
ncbi:coenzyme F420 biosynthesis-associated protein [Saccharomonospora piscinae]|uniref:zinc-dependent metalloprotease n=1 Tax=Saccharomonospora piscinae TaxID=687388 RepID=UPI001106EFA2|nr:zinc-dependent metalloprotease [Saccharomonospora piscinae]TLW93913.1 coenzyme F420 biosynthesis-associated protein [Saccharomonospora piscinae]